MAKGFYRGYQWPNSGKDPRDPEYNDRLPSEDEWYDALDSYFEDKADERRCER